MITALDATALIYAMQPDARRPEEKESQALVHAYVDWLKVAQQDEIQIPAPAYSEFLAFYASDDQQKQIAAVLRRGFVVTPLDEAKAENNHSVAYFLQLAVFADFASDTERVALSRRRFKETLLPLQLAPDGSFPRELARTKPYGYSVFQLEIVVALCHVLSSEKDDLWRLQLSEGRSVRQAMQFLYPYLADKSKWPYAKDVEHWEGWPTRQSSLLFAGLAYQDQKYLDLWERLAPDPADPEVQRNMPITQPILWIQ